MLFLHELTWRSGAVGVFDGQFELLNEVGSVEAPLLPDVQQSLHVLFTVLICITAGREDESSRRTARSKQQFNRNKWLNTFLQKKKSLWIIKKTIISPLSLVYFSADNILDIVDFRLFFIAEKKKLAPF